jgi:hypothetical protein
MMGKLSLKVSRVWNTWDYKYPCRTSFSHEHPRFPMRTLHPFAIESSSLLNNMAQHHPDFTLPSSSSTATSATDNTSLNPSSRSPTPVQVRPARHFVLWFDPSSATDPFVKQTTSSAHLVPSVTYEYRLQSLHSTLLRRVQKARLRHERPITTLVRFIS